MGGRRLGARHCRHCRRRRALRSAQSQRPFQWYARDLPLTGLTTSSTPKAWLTAKADCVLRGSRPQAQTRGWSAAFIGQNSSSVRRSNVKDRRSDRRKCLKNARDFQILIICYNDSCATFLAGTLLAVNSRPV